MNKEQKLKLLQIEEARMNLSIELENGVINEKDILSLLRVKNNFGLRERKKFYTYKQTVLMNIFNSPFILCDQDNLSDEIKSILPLFLYVRYNIELEELDSHYKEGYLSDEEYNYEKELLYFCYYESSLEGKMFSSEGKVNRLIKVK